MIGLQRGIVVLQQHDACWELLGRDHVNRIKSALGNLVIEVAHVGSTSVPGLCAKPIIDIAVGVQTLSLQIVQALEQAGYLYRPAHDDKGHMLFVDGVGEIRYAHVHVVEYMGMEWRNYINFRDYLTAFPEKREDYAALKIKLAQQYSNDRDRYTAEKAEFIQYTLRKAMVWSFLGKQIEAVVDRPVGYVHHKGDKTLIYPINYGYIPNVLGGDGEELDVYYLGIQKPLKSFTGRVIAIVHRHDDVEDKLVAAPLHSDYSAEEVAHEIYFQEKYFDTTVEILSGEKFHIGNGEE